MCDELRQSSSTIPGFVAKHAIITDECRLGRGANGAFEEAVERLRLEYAQCVEGWKDHKVNFHIVMTVERLEETE